jgi:uncharacterized LabA/DUF88 family protein
MSVALFIDKANLDILWRGVDSRLINFARLLTYIELTESDRIAEAYCCDATENGEWTSCHKAMAHAGIRPKVYRYAYEPIADAIDRHTGVPVRRRIQKGVDVGLATRMIESHRLSGWNHLLLAASDADFAEPVQHLVETYGVRVTALGIPERISFALKPYITAYYDLRKIADDIVNPARLASSAAPVTSLQRGA